MGSRGPAARRRVWKRDSKQSKYAGRSRSKQYLAFDSIEEHDKIPLDERAGYADFRHQTSFTRHATVHAEGSVFQIKSDDCHGHPFEPRGKGSCATTKCPEKAWLRIRPGDCGRDAQAEELQIEGNPRGSGKNTAGRRGNAVGRRKSSETR